MTLSLNKVLKCSLDLQMQGKGPFLVQKFLFSKKYVPNDVNNLCRFDAHPFLFGVNDDLVSQDGKRHICDSFNGSDFFDLIVIDKKEVMGRNNERVLDFFVVGIFGREVKDSAEDAQNILFHLKFFLYQCDQLFVSLLVHHCVKVFKFE